MFLKMFGAAFVIAGCSALGIGYGRKLNLHLEELRFLRELYRMIRGEIQYTKEPIPEVMLEVSSRIKEPYASLFVQAHRAFEEQGSLQFPQWFRSYTSGTLESYRRERGMTDEETCRSGRLSFPGNGGRRGSGRQNPRSDRSGGSEAVWECLAGCF